MAPERGESGADKVTAYNATLVDGQTVRLVITDKGNGRDNSGWLLADVYVPDRPHLNVLIVENTVATAERR